MAAEAKPADAVKARHATALGQFKFIAEIESPQRKNELEALRFEAGDMWTEEAKVARAGLPANAGTGTPAVPARPMLTMRTLDQPLAQISSMAASADLGIKIIPKDGKANKDTAEIRAGLIRAIEADSHAKGGAYAWGFQRMRSCGRGYWRVNKTYASEQGGFDQVLRIDPIQNGASVYQHPIKRWIPEGGFWEPDVTFVTEDMSAIRYKAEFGESKLAKASESEALTALGDYAKDWTWFSVDSEGKNTSDRYYRIAEVFYATYETTKSQDRDEDGKPRDIVTRKVMWGKMNGIEWLVEPQEWDGEYIPVICDSGNTYDLGGQVVYEGMIQPAMAPCRMVNYLVSNSAEKFGRVTSAPWMVVAGQLQGFEGWWQQANVRNFPYLEYNAKTAGTGNDILPPPTRTNDDPHIADDMQAVGMFINFVRSTTGVPDAALGHVNPNDRSGKAVEALKAASEQGSSNWLNYHANAIRHTGVVLNNLLGKVYDAPGRVERILGKDGSAQSVMLNAPFTRGQDGQPVPHQPSMFGRLKQAMGMGQQAEIEHHKLDEGQYSVIVDVGKDQQTRRQNQMVGLSNLAQAVPELVPRFADLWVRSMDIPDADAIADRIKPPEEDDMQNLPEPVKAQIQQMQTVIQELQQAADDNKTKIQIAQGGDQTKGMIAASADETKKEVASIQAQASIATAEIKAGMDDMSNQIKLLVAMMGVEKEDRLAHKAAALEERRALHQAGHEVSHSIMTHEHAKELAQIGHEQALEVGDVAHQQALEQAAQPPAIDPNKQLGAE